jgi:photosystem II stability/assembly factor-like uncharacterized protein
MKRSLSIFTLLIMSFFSHAQNLGWRQVYGSTTGGDRYNDLYFTSKDTGFIVREEILKTTDGGKTWTPKTNYAASGKPIHIRSIEFLNDHITGIAGTFNGIVLRTVDGGETWQNITSSVPDTTAGPGKRNICGLANLEDNFYGVGASHTDKARFYKSIDKGLTWTVTIMDTNLGNQLVDVFFVSKDTGFVSGSKNSGSSMVSEESVVLKTTDGGLTWTKVFSDTVIGGRIWKLQFLNDQIAYGAIEPKYPTDTVAIIRTVDGGNNWKIIGVSRENSSIPIGTQSIGFINPMKGWVGGWYSGMFETGDGGLTWTKFKFGKNLNRFFVLDTNDMVACGLGMYRYGDTTKFTSIGSNPDKPVTLRLDPVYPNPAGGHINIEFEISFTTNILLEIVNVDAKRTYKLFNKVHTPGKYKYPWDISHLPNGNYLIWMDNDLAPITQKFIINKHN